MTATETLTLLEAREKSFKDLLEQKSARFNAEKETVIKYFSSLNSDYIMLQAALDQVTEKSWFGTLSSNLGAMNPIAVTQTIFGLLQTPSSDAIVKTGAEVALLKDSVINTTYRAQQYAMDVAGKCIKGKVNSFDEAKSVLAQSEIAMLDLNKKIEAAQKAHDPYKDEKTSLFSWHTTEYNSTKAALDAAHIAFNNAKAINLSLAKAIEIGNNLSEFLGKTEAIENQCIQLAHDHQEILQNQKDLIDLQEQIKGLKENIAPETVDMATTEQAPVKVQQDTKKTVDIDAMADEITGHQQPLKSNADIQAMADFITSPKTSPELDMTKVTALADRILQSAAVSKTPENGALKLVQVIFEEKSLFEDQDHAAKESLGPQEKLKAANAYADLDIDGTALGEIWNQINPKINLMSIQIAHGDNPDKVASESAAVLTKAKEALDQTMAKAITHLDLSLKHDAKTITQALDVKIEATTKALATAQSTFDGFKEAYQQQWNKLFYPTGYKEAQQAVLDNAASLEQSKLLHDQVEVLDKTVNAWRGVCQTLDAHVSAPGDTAAHDATIHVAPIVTHVAELHPASIEN